MADGAPPRTPWCLLLGSTAGYYGSSVSVILFNKWVMSSQGFSFPYFVTLMYLIVKGLECGLLQWCFGLPGRSFATWWEYFTRVILVGVLVGGSICLQNVSFLFVTVALYTMVGATVPVFQLCWALSPCFQLEKPSRGLVSAILCVVSGLVLIAYGATDVNPIGLVILLTSVTIGGLNQVIVQSQLQRDGGKYLAAPAAPPHAANSAATGNGNGQAYRAAAGGKAPKLNPIVFTWEIAPWASLTALGFTLSFDLQPMLASPFLASADTFLPVLGGLCGSGTLVCIDVLFQRTIVQSSSALTLSIISSIKELLTVFAGILVFDDEVTVIQFVGMGVAVFGVKLYGSQRRKEVKLAQKEYERVRLEGMQSAREEEEEKTGLMSAENGRGGSSP